jgi:predicted nucleic acid-binding protein
MRVVVDTSVWSLAFRRKAPVQSGEVELLKDLIQDGRVVLLGVVRQELLSGIRHAEQFERLRERLRAFPDPPVEREDHETAATYFNACMAAGVQGSTIDFLICAFAARRGYQIFTTDPDFLHFARHIPVALLMP